jgi:3-phenylpropionate/cinnamic acid dioxygenase small subunit
VTVLTLVPRYADIVDDSDMARWLAAHADLIEHWESAHPDDVAAPCAACKPLEREEALLFARVLRMGEADA